MTHQTTPADLTSLLERVEKARCWLAYQLFMVLPLNSWAWVKIAPAAAKYAFEPKWVAERTLRSLLSSEVERG